MRGAVLAALVFGAGGQPASPRVDRSHAAWTALLQRYDHAGFVDYAGIAREGRGAVQAYLASLAAVNAGEYQAWSRADQMAFWIDAYNASVVELVLMHYPIRSIREIGFLPLAAFRERFIPIALLGAPPLSLNAIEDHLRACGDPRVHFALVCASKSCPPLRTEAYRGADLDAQLDDQARRFLADPAKNRFDAAADVLYLSKIFDWYAKDFGPGPVTDFVARYAPPGIVTALARPTPLVEYLDYDWSLNWR